MSQKIPTSLIVLKHTITEGRVPTPDMLEVGEVALGLFKGQESIWSKNNSGEIVNLRSPRHDLMWGDFFKKYNTKSEFETDLGEGKILDTSIVFIKSEGLLWTDGNYYNSSYTEKELETIITQFIISIPSEVYSLNSESTSDEILSVFESVDNFKNLLNKSLSGEVAISGLSIPDGGTIPVSVIPKVYSEDKSELKLEWISGGYYNTLIITLDSEIFSVIKSFGNLSNYYEVETKVNQYLTFNKPLVTPVISGTWTFYKHNSDEVVNDIDGTNLTTNPTIETGYSAVFSGTYSWENKDGYKSPTGIVSGSKWSDLPESGVSSQVYTSDKLTQTTNISITLKAPKTGMMVSGNDIVGASGDDQTSTKRTITFNGRSFYGQYEVEEGEEITITEEVIKELSSSLVSGKSKKFTGLTVDKNSYFIYSYPKSFGKISQIIQDGATPILGAFYVVEIDITNSSGAVIPMYAYVSNNPGIFTNATVEFK